jgi:hypothetical protein
MECSRLHYITRTTMKKLAICMTGFALLLQRKVFMVFAQPMRKDRPGPRRSPASLFNAGA